MNVIRLAVTPSTQDAARHLPIGSCVVTNYQTQGRGRNGRSWESPPEASLLASFVLPPRTLAMFAAGVAAAEACGGAARLKWPNDLLLDGDKLGGILIEQHEDRCLVGIGINLLWAPPGGACLGVDRDLLLELLTEKLTEWFGCSDQEILAAWRQRADTLGRRVRVELADEIFEGRAWDIAPDGALMVGQRKVYVGDVLHLRPAKDPSPSSWQDN